MIVTPSSGNRKIGPIAATYRPVGPTCPLDCPLLPQKLQRKAKNGKSTRRPLGSPVTSASCYAASGLVSSVAQRSDEISHDLSQARAAPLIRHLVSGDWLKPTADGRRVVDRDLLRAVCDWHCEPSQRFTIGWGYTHSPDRLDAAGFGPWALPPGLEIMASCHSKDEARQLQKDGWRTARLAPDKSGGLDQGEAWCPYDVAKRDGVPIEQRPTCASCRMCPDKSGPNIVFIEL